MVHTNAQSLATQQEEDPMFKKFSLIALVLLTPLLMTSCAAIDALQLLYGNKFASHSWQQDEEQTTLSFDVLNQHTIIPVTVNNAHDLRLVLDTGAPATVIFETPRTRALMSSLGKKISVNGIGKNDKTNAYFIQDTDVTVGTATITGLTTIFIKAEDNPLFTSQDVTYMDGVIGYDLFSRFATDINFSKNVIRFSENSTSKVKGYQSLPLNIENNLSFLDISVKGGENSSTLPVMLDTGAVGSLFVDAGQEVPPHEEFYRTTSAGLGGETPVIISRLDAVSLGNYEVPNVIASISQDKPTKTKINILGAGLLNRFNLIVDYPSQQLHLTPNENFTKPDYANVFGLTLLPHTNGAFVDSVRTGSSADKGGLQAADVITHVDGQSISYQNYDAMSEKLATLNSVREVCFLRNNQKTCKAVNL